MATTIAREQRQAVKRNIIAQIEQGASVQQASIASDISMHRATAYQLLKRVRTEGETAFSDGRHGHPIKLRGEVRTFLIEFCRTSPGTPIHVIKNNCTQALTKVHPCSFKRARAGVIKN